MFIIISKKLNVNGNLYEILENYFKILNKDDKQYAKKLYLKYDDYRKIAEHEKSDYVNRKLNMLPIHKELSNIDSNKTQMDNDATSLYPSAMWDENSVYPKLEAGFAFRPHMNHVNVEAVNYKTFN